MSVSDAVEYYAAEDLSEGFDADFIEHQEFSSSPDLAMPSGSESNRAFATL